jgi:glycosyltransferase involved in cell wall biosynthesis
MSSSLPSLSIVIPTKDERGNVENAVRRMPDFGTRTEILFVDGHSADGTMAEVDRVRRAWPDKLVRGVPQEGQGKRGAVWHGFTVAEGEVVMILDGDLTVPPEELLPAFHAVAAAPDVFLNGTRFRRPMEKGAMERPNWLANRVFARWVSRIVGVPLTDTLCGTKALWKRTFLALKERAFLAGMDRYGDHELLFGAWNLGCRIEEHAFNYRARTWGEAKIAKQKLSGGSAFARICLAAQRAKWSGRAPEVARRQR